VASRAKAADALRPEGRAVLLDWATAAGLLAGKQVPGAQQCGEVLELVGSQLNMLHLGTLMRARIAELVLGAKSASELGTLIRALDKPPAWLCHEDDVAPAEMDQPANAIAGPTLPDKPLEELLSDTRRLIAEIEAEQKADP
jgi:hypothetical protein